MLRRNSLAAVLQVVVVGASLFLSYSFLYRSLGVTALGVWSMLTAIASVARIGDLGLAGAVVRFVADLVARRKYREADALVQTAMSTIGLVVAGICCFGYVVAQLAIARLPASPAITLVSEILPFVLVSYVLMFIAGVLCGALDGLRRTDIRSLLVAGSAVLNLVVVLLSVPKLGLMGFALGQLLQYFFLALAAWVSVRTQLGVRSLLPSKWSRRLLRKIIRFSAGLQVITLSSAVLEPAIKLLVARWGGVDSLGFFEMANKLVVQIRGLIVEGTRVLVAEVAHSRATAISSGMALATASRVVLVSSSLAYLFAAICMPAASIVWLGHYSAEFVCFALLMCFGWFANTIIGPIYFHNLGTGTIGSNILSHVAMTLVGVVAGYLGGLMFGSLGVVGGYALGLASGTAILLTSAQKENGLSLLEGVRRHGIVDVACLLAVAVAVNVALSRHQQPLLVSAATAAGLLCVLVAFARTKLIKRDASKVL